MIAHVVDGVHIGDWTDAAGLFMLRTDGKVKPTNFVIVSVAGDTPFGTRGDFVFHMVDGADDNNAWQLWQARNRIAKCVEEKRPVLVHCAVGASRSPSVVIAYLMKIKHMEYDEALKMVQQARPIANIHPALAQMLREWNDIKHVHDGVEFDVQE
jgi:hypothetical protein